MLSIPSKMPIKRNEPALQDMMWNARDDILLMDTEQDTEPPVCAVLMLPRQSKRH